MFFLIRRKSVQAVGLTAIGQVGDITISESEEQRLQSLRPVFQGINIGRQGALAAKQVASSNGSFI